MLFEFVLFAILGWTVFAPPEGNLKLVLMIVFIVLMIVWVAVGFSPGMMGSWGHLFQRQ